MMNIKVLGMGCANCRRLEENVARAVADLGIEATIEKVTDFPTILAYGVTSTPALVVEERVVAAGRVPDAGQLRSLLAPT
jgi:small redox-active disulfide protein 2